MRRFEYSTYLIRNLICVYLFASYVLSKEDEEAVGSCKQKNNDSGCAIQDKTLQNCIELNHKTLRPQDPSWFIIVPKGRLGNHIVGYSVIQALAATIQIRPLITEETETYLKKYFDVKHNISIFENTFCNVDEIELSKMKYFEGSIDEVVQEKKYHRGHILNLWPRGYMPEIKICCPSLELHQYVNDHYLEEVRASLPLQKQFQGKVDEIKAGIANGLNLEIEDVTFVGLHDRRTDYIDYSAERYGLKPLKKSYFKDAMEYFKEEFDNVVFLWISDDMDWGRKNFKNKKDIYFVGYGENSEIKNDDSIGYDLGLLIESNHNIVTRGTFGMWAAVLCGGEYYGPYGPIVPGRLILERQKKKKKKKRKN